MDLGGGVGLELVRIPAGEFLIGSSARERAWSTGAEGGAGKGDRRERFEGDPRPVRVPNAFWMGRTEVTVGQWSRFVEETGFVTDAEKPGGETQCYTPEWRAGSREPQHPGKSMPDKSWRDPNFPFAARDDHPVVCVSWDDCMAFCRWLTRREREAGRLPRGLVYRLPTDAEWEYACRGGRENTIFWWGNSLEDGEGRLNINGADLLPGRDHGWDRTEAPWSDGFPFLSPVDHFGERGRNGFGLADTLGNVWEICLDHWDPNGAHETVCLDETPRRVCRGVSFLAIPGYSRCAVRLGLRGHQYSDSRDGFRLCLGPQPGALRGARKKAQVAPWQSRAVDYARIMSRVKWTPVADGMPRRGGRFEAGKVYTGVPYSSVKAEGRYIGFDIFLKTFLAAVENSKSVLYTENLKGRVTNAECYYGKVCSSYTSYALQCGIWYVSRLHGPEHRDGIIQVESQSAQTARVGDVIFTPPPPKGGGSHVEIVTGITRDKNGRATHVLIEESSPQTTRNTNRSAKAFNAHLASRNKKLYRITDLDAWRGSNRAESFLFPNYAEDSATPEINRVLLLDRGDWVPYFKGQTVKFNVMDRDGKGVKALVIKRGAEIVEKVPLSGRGVVERAFETCGDYTAHCVMTDGASSAACEFAVCALDFTAPKDNIPLGEPWELQLSSDNMKPIIAHLNNGHNGYAHRNVFITDEDRRKGRVVIPADLITEPADIQIWLIGENRHGRLKKRRDVVIGN